ncbi:MAG TPA: hypothetical protein VKX41_16670 [Alloacidobacterium sp.]|jgi:hypothetical protein|nr:hypothetical protein [Alloacidobacterium sp.]
MMPPRELNPSNELRPGITNRGSLAADEGAISNLRDRIMELESRNSYLQSLVVELLDKNEKLRRIAAQKQTVADASQ